MGTESAITALMMVADTEALPQMSVYGRTEFVQLVGITEAEVNALAARTLSVTDLAERMRAAGNPDLVTDMRRTTSYV